MTSTGHQWKKYKGNKLGTKSNRLCVFALPLEQSRYPWDETTFPKEFLGPKVPKD